MSVDASNSGHMTLSAVPTQSFMMQNAPVTLQLNSKFVLATVMGSTGVLNAAITIRQMRLLGIVGPDTQTTVLIGGLETVRKRRFYETTTRRIAQATGEFGNIRIWRRRRWSHGHLSVYIRELQAMFDQTPDLLLVVRAWQPINESVLHAFPHSTHVCIGDGFGVAIEDPSHFGAAPLHEDGFLSFSHASLLLHQPNHKTSTPPSSTCEILTPELRIAEQLLTDVGQSLPELSMTEDQLGDRQKRLVVVAAHTLISPSVDGPQGAPKDSRAKSPMFVARLLKDAIRGIGHRMGWSGEVRHTANLYMTILETCLKQRDIVYVKPHPRDTSALIRILRRRLKHRRIELLRSSNSLDLVPLEILFRPLGVDFLIAPNCHSGELPEALGYIDSKSIIKSIPSALRHTYRF